MEGEINLTTARNLFRQWPEHLASAEFARMVAVNLESISEERWERVVESLTDREREVLFARLHGVGRSSLARKARVSVERVRQLEHQGLRKVYRALAV